MSIIIANPEVKDGEKVTETWELMMDGHGNIHGRKKYGRTGVHISATEIVNKLRRLQTGELWI